jgi:prepilin-type processing-associated H-X9-DG protein
MAPIIGCPFPLFAEAYLRATLLGGTLLQKPAKARTAQRSVPTKPASPHRASVNFVFLDGNILFSSN